LIGTRARGVGVAGGHLVRVGCAVMTAFGLGGHRGARLVVGPDRLSVDAGGGTDRASPDILFYVGSLYGAV
jgi:hypothetical protein